MESEGVVRIGWYKVGVHGHDFGETASDGNRKECENYESKAGARIEREMKIGGCPRN